MYFGNCILAAYERHYLHSFKRRIHSIQLSIRRMGSFSTVILFLFGSFGICYALESACAAPRGRSVLPVILGRSCGLMNSATLSATVCSGASRYRSISGYEIRGVSARGLQSRLRKLTMHESTIIFFYGRHCRFSAKSLPTFAAVAARLPLCALLVEVKQFPALGAAYGVHGLPSIMRLRRNEMNERYIGDRSYRHLLAWATNVTETKPIQPRYAPHHLPILDIQDVISQPDWMLIISLCICSAAALSRFTSQRKRNGLQRNIQATANITDDGTVNEGSTDVSDGVGDDGKEEGAPEATGEQMEEQVGDEVTERNVEPWDNNTAMYS